MSLVLAFLIGFFFEASIGMIGFWFLEVTSFLYVVNTLNFFVSGHMFPLDLLPPFWATILKALPFQYLAYFPAAVFLGKIQGWPSWCRRLLIEAAWARAVHRAGAVLYPPGPAALQRLRRAEAMTIGRPLLPAARRAWPATAWRASWRFAATSSSRSSSRCSGSASC